MSASFDSGHEKRQYLRLEQLFSAKFQRHLGQAPKWNVIYLRDLSGGGLLFNHGTKLELGETIRVVITFPAASMPIECDAVVIRIKRWEGPLEVYQIAASFVDMPEDQKELIVNALEALARSRSRSGPFRL